MSGFTTSVSVLGKARLAITATSAAPNVPSRYRNKIGRILVLVWPFCLVMAAVTKINTKNGAMPFSAPTNRLPKIPVIPMMLFMKPDWAEWAICPMMLPKIKPVIICQIRRLLPFGAALSADMECLLHKVDL